MSEQRKVSHENCSQEPFWTFQESRERGRDEFARSTQAGSWDMEVKVSHVI